MRKVVSLMLSLVLTASLLTGCSDNKTSSNGEVIVYNWGEYIDPEVITQFEEETGINTIVAEEPAMTVAAGTGEYVEIMNKINGK